MSDPIRSPSDDPLPPVFPIALARPLLLPERAPPVLGSTGEKRKGGKGEGKERHVRARASFLLSAVPFRNFVPIRVPSSVPFPRSSRTHAHIHARGSASFLYVRVCTRRRASFRIESTKVLDPVEQGVILGPTRVRRNHTPVTRKGTEDTRFTGRLLVSFLTSVVCSSLYVYICVLYRFPSLDKEETATGKDRPCFYPHVASSPLLSTRCGSNGAHGPVPRRTTRARVKVLRVGEASKFIDYPIINF